jgi:hypothetical protein
LASFILQLTHLPQQLVGFEAVAGFSVGLYSREDLGKDSVDVSAVLAEDCAEVGGLQGIGNPSRSLTATRCRLNHR